MLEVYLTTLAGVVLGQIAPGPNLLAVAATALSQGRRPALLVALGVATAVFAWVTLAVTGLAALIAVAPAALTAMKLAGGAYLCALAAKALLAAWRGAPRDLVAARGAPLSGLRAYARGLAVNLTNPKSALMWSAVATYLIGSGLTTAQALVIAPLGAASALIVYGGYAALLSSGPARSGYAAFARRVEAGFGLAFGLVGGRLVVDGLRDLAR
ncbi:MAG: LysE family transporter [Rhizobiales bacterium]|nr:LysE family transporter [Hyphomicrobiales bacterium]